MSTFTVNCPCDNSSLANFKAWAQAGISAGLAAVGLTKTADSGQVNWATLASVPSSAYVYEVWQAADSLASAMPWVMKVEYGYSATSPQVRITLGTGSNGSGTITGQLTGTPWIITQQNSNNGTTSYPCYFCGDPGNFRMYMWGGAASGTALTLVVERSHDTSGNDTSEFVTVLTNNNWSGSSVYQQTFSASSQGPQFLGVLGTGIPSTPGTTAYNGVPVPFPILPIFGKLGNSMWEFSVCQSDAADGTTITINNLYGASHSFLACCPYGNRNNYASNLGARVQLLGLLIRWE